MPGVSVSKAFISPQVVMQPSLVVNPGVSHGSFVFCLQVLSGFDRRQMPNDKLAFSLN